MKADSQSLLRDYQAAMREHLSQPDEGTLQRAYQLGRKALDQGLGIVDTAELYHRALAAALRSARTPAECDKTVQALESFFVESLSPYEMTHRSHVEAHATLRHLNELLEDESKRIARALHDESGQLLVAVHLALEALVQDLPPGFESLAQNVTAALDEVESQLRRLSHELRPPILDDLGLLPALRFLADGFSSRTGIEVTVAGVASERYLPVVETALYRIVQEALTNVNKHAKASRVIVRFERPRKNLLKCSIQDNGAGFDAERVLGARMKRGLGLAGIQERLRALQGGLEIKSGPGSGTELLLQVPLGE